MTDTESLKEAIENYKIQVLTLRIYMYIILMYNLSLS